MATTKNVPGRHERGPTQGPRFEWGRRARARLGRGLALLCGAAVIAASAPATPAAAAPDTTPPALGAPRTGSFIVGSTVFDYANGLTAAQMLLTWSATDASGICSTSVYEERAGGDRAALIENALWVTAWTVHVDDDDWSEGGVQQMVVAWQIEVTDCAGNTTTRRVPVSLLAYWESSAVYAGGWTTSTCECWLHETTRRTTNRGASAVHRREFQPGEHIGVVMTKGPGRGRVDIFVDGRYRATADTYAPTLRPGTVVWESWMPRGVHEVKLVNRATPGRPLIDLDALLATG